MRSTTRTHVISFTVLALSLPLSAWAVTCGDILGPGGVYTLTEDVICEGDGPAITVRDGAVLDLAGHLVRRPLIGILLEGQGAVLRNGRVESFGPGENGIGVQVQGGGRHQITGVSARGRALGMLVESDHNRLTENTASGDTGFSIGGRHNFLRRNVGGGLEGFAVHGDGNRLIENATDELLLGFGISGSRNLLLRNGTVAFEGFIVGGDQNLVLQNQASGSLAIVVSGEGNGLIQNTALRSEKADRGTLVDTHGDCTHNRWIANTADAADPACILEDGAVAGLASR